MNKFKRLQQGFTLIELMVVVAIIGILAAIAFPIYTQYIIHSNRAAAKSEMMAIANREEQFLLANRAYASVTQIAASGYSLPSQVSAKYDYDITLGTDTVPTYTIEFKAKGSQLSDGNLKLNNFGAKTPAEKW